MGVSEVVQIDGIPVFIASTGTADLELKVYIACRNGYVYLYKGGKISTSFNVRIESKPLGLLKLDKTLVLAGMNKNLYSFYNKGRLNFIKTLPAEITDIQKMEVKQAKNIQCVLVSLKNGDIMMFNDKHHIDTI